MTKDDEPQAKRTRKRSTTYAKRVELRLTEEQFDRVINALETKLPDVADHLETARADILAFTAFPKEIWRQIWSNNPQERLNKEIKRRTKVALIFPNEKSIERLVSALLMELSQDWETDRIYVRFDEGQEACE